MNTNLDKLYTILGQTYLKSKLTKGKQHEEMINKMNGISKTIIKILESNKQ